MPMSIPGILPGFVGAPLATINVGALPPSPLRPWHWTHPLSMKRSRPSFAVPCPGGSSWPSGLMAMSHARTSSGVGARPRWYVGDCALSVAPRISTKASSGGRVLLNPADLSDRALEEIRIVHAPIGPDLPHLDRVVGALHVELRCERLVPELGDPPPRRLPLSQL